MILDRTCDICNKSKAIIDGKTKMGPWAYMCKDCFNEVGTGLFTPIIDKSEFNKLMEVQINEI